MSVVALRRYPVKSMGGEALEHARFDPRGLAGDRWFAVEDGEGRFASGKNTRRFRRRDHVFEYTAHTASNGHVVVTGNGSVWTVGDPALDEHLSSVIGAQMRVAPENQVPHQDAGAVSLISTATLRWCAEQWGVHADPRRLRANIVVGSDEPFIEETWIGRTISIGSAQLRVAERAHRCRTIDIAQDGAVPEGNWLKPLAAHRGMNLAVYAVVTTPGECVLGDRVIP